LLNGKSLGRKSIDPIDVTATWSVPFAPGKLEAVGFKAGKEVSRYAVETTGEAVGLKLVPDRTELANDGRDAMPVTVEAVDAQGRVVPTAHPLAIFTTKGPGEVIGVANGNPICHESDKGDRRSLYNGLAQVILQSTVDGENPITLTASSEGLKPATVTLSLQQVPAVHTVPVVSSSVLMTRWFQSPASNVRPDPNQTVSKTDMNTNTAVSPGSPQALIGGRYALLRSSFNPRAVLRKVGGKLIFKDFNGKAEVFIDGKSAGHKDEFKATTFEVAVSPGGGEHNVVIVLEQDPNKPAGFGGVVTVIPNSK